MSTQPTVYTKKDWEKASDLTMFNRDIISKSDDAACYSCMRVFKASDVCEFIDDGVFDSDSTRDHITQDITALCPCCGIDAVLGDATGLPIHNLEYLQTMHAFGFSTDLG